MAEFFFYVSIGLIVYTYFGYPILLGILSIGIEKQVRRADIFPEVTVIIPVHNEELLIEKKIRNCLAFDYPLDRLKIIVASDNSTDRTEEIVKQFDPERIRFVSLFYRGGKVMAQNLAMLQCDSPIVLFTDVAISTTPDCVRLIVQNFNDPTIGVVSCKDAIIEDHKHPEGEKSYIRYDMMVRKFSSKVASLVGVTGGFYAVRREIAKGGWNPAFPPDFYVAIRAIKRGFRVVEDSRVVAGYRTAAKEWDELPRKVRTINRGMHALFSYSNRGVLNPFKYGFISIQLISHKLLRWLTPIFLLTLFLSSIELAQRSILIFIFLWPQVALYLVSITGFVFRNKFSDFALIKLANYFVIANLGILRAWAEFILNKRYVMWQPTRR